jgi:hypothetical protein
LTAHQLTNDYVLHWLHECLSGECPHIAWNDEALAQMKSGFGMADVLYVLRTAESTCGGYNGNCFLVCGRDLDGEWLTVVVAPPSNKNRVRVVNAWKGK